MAAFHSRVARLHSEVRLSKCGRADLLVMGPHGRGAVLQALLGSATLRVLADAGCDVLVAGL